MVEATERSVRVVVVHDHQLLADGLRSALCGDGHVEVVAGTTDEEEAQDLVRDLRADVVVVECELQGSSAFDVARRLLDDQPDLKVLLLTGYGDHDHLAVRAVEAGFAGVVPRRSSIDDLARAVRQVHDGNTAFSPDDLSRALRQARGAASRGAATLSDREMQVLELVAQGVTTEKIAAEIDVTVHTVRGHVRKILTKLGAHSKVEAVNVAYRRGLLHL